MVIYLLSSSTGVHVALQINGAIMRMPVQENALKNALTARRSCGDGTAYSSTIRGQGIGSDVRWGGCSLLSLALVLSMST